MPRLIVTEGAVRGLSRCRAFLEGKSAEAARRAGRIIAERLAQLEATPAMGRPFAPDMAMRELVIEFGDSGYVALYRHEPADDAVYLLAFRHQREAGY
ncbi:type II toxin-antitoxin system RelE/ParE family toxin [Rhizorhabdus dicambivorans]|uniref:Type II toxin-antitoxin system RelE/ParE family toxin n=1 Tax=Rhizorhabdus dicambivorans TaxID=1850238 RepID=A0A2A4FZR9_9SPHN|nr:type II toxin-antitoxin system RelE/ParE family toxin [Rhizorhabdus dicambivorans]ATE63056.1 type II toxin-antitoxin system RelE/ParE family toxin [Rhizorhabdus dicambivorans]PCE43233.1 type II toxin-antitoxin system RelE/ParE family toxin [Rhizorhabdus dicambivorans]